MKKKIIFLFTLFLCFGLFSCEDNANDKLVKLNSPVIALNNNVVEWGEVQHAKGYIVSVDDVAKPEQTGLTYTITEDKVGEYKITVIAVGDAKKYSNSDASNSVNYSIKATENVQLTAPVITLEGNVVSWNAVDNAEGYKVTVNGVQGEKQTTTNYTIADTGVTEYTITVIAIGDIVTYLNSKASNEVKYITMAQTTLFLVGDSTVCKHEDSYYYPRYGYGTQMSNYLSDKVTVNNLALSGRSSRSFLKEENYTTFKDSIKAGDYVIIGFGHNDQKQELDRYANPNLPHTDSSTTFEGKEGYGAISFQYVLYNYYIKVAKDAGATPILATPMIRLDANSNYAGSKGHIIETKTVDGISYTGGDYAEAIRDLSTETGTTLIDLTTKTKEYFTNAGYTESSNYFAWTNSKVESLDSTHTNILGAKLNAFFIADALKASSNSLKNYVKADIVMPTKATDLVVNPDYVEKTYEPFDSSKASPNYTLISEGWYGTMFGDTGTSDSSLYTVTESEAGTFKLGNTIEKGKIASSSEGIAMIFKQVDISKNFKISANVSISQYGGNQSGFGLMLRDDIYIDAGNDKSILSNYIAAGCYSNSTNANAIYCRENTKLAPENQITAPEAEFATTLSIVRVGSSVTVTFGELTKTYYDFDLTAIDNQFMYVGMYATRKTIATFTNVAFEITGDAQEA